MATLPTPDSLVQSLVDALSPLLTPLLRSLPLLDAVRTRMSEAVDAGMGERDWSAIADYTLNHNA